MSLQYDVCRAFTCRAAEDTVCQTIDRAGFFTCAGAALAAERAALLPALRQLPRLARATRLEELVPWSSARRFEAGATLAARGGGACLWVILEGEARATRGGATFGPGDVIGPDARAVSVRAGEPWYGGDVGECEGSGIELLATSAVACLEISAVHVAMLKVRSFVARGGEIPGL